MTETEPSTMRPRRARLSVGAVVAIALSTALMAGSLGTFAWAATNQRHVIDQGRVWSFTPDATITSYIERSTMTERGEFLFLASKPEVLPKENFDSICSSKESGGGGIGTLGCYLPRTKQIFLYDVTDDRLDGLEEVVASHEMLHAVWDRMSPAERDTLAPLLEAEAEKLASNPDFTARMDFYAVNEPGERLNELHSIIGTEATDLSPELQAHYATYFEDQPAVVTLHAQSNSVFEDLKARSEGIAAEMEALRLGIETDYARYTSGYEAINGEIAVFNDRATAGDFSSQYQFDSEREELLGRVEDLDTLFADIQARNGQYDALRAQLVDLNAEAEELNKSINIEPKSGETP